jgi:transketolase
VEEHQINGGLGSAVAELASEHHPIPLFRIGVKDRFGESGQATELIEHFGLSAPHIVAAAREVVKRKAG